MYKKFKVIFLCVALMVSFAACNGQGSTDKLKEAGPQDTQGNGQAAEDTDGGSLDSPTDGSSDRPGNGAEGSGGQEALLGPDATEEELLEALSDEITVVTDDNYVEMVTAFTENTEAYSGQIYQMEGVYKLVDEAPYIARTIVDGEKRSVSGMPLKYVTGDPEEGAWIRVTGIVNEGHGDGEPKAVLEVVVLQALEGQGQAELSAQ